MIERHKQSYREKLSYNFDRKFTIQASGHGSVETVKELAADPKHLGALPGFTSILHTWGQNLNSI